MRLILGTDNPAKQARLRWMLKGLAVEILLPADLSGRPAVEEGDVSIRANAELKAQAWARAAGLPALATDGGLHVPALGGGWNPARTRRAAGAGVSDAERAAHLLALMRGRSGPERAAVFCEAVALATPDGRVRSWEVFGEPAEVAETYDERELPHGFWVAGVLRFGPERRRYAELGPEEREWVADGHWAKLKPLVRAGVAELIRGECPR